MSADAGPCVVGDRITPLQRIPTEIQLFRYCAVTGNSHRIHYDAAYAASEGYPNVLVQSHLHGAFFTSLCTNWIGPDGRLLTLSYSVRRFACPHDVLQLRGTVTAIEADAVGGTVSLDLEEVRQSDDVVCATGRAEVFLPAGVTVAVTG